MMHSFLLDLDRIFLIFDAFVEGFVNTCFFFLAIPSTEVEQSLHVFYKEYFRVIENHQKIL